MNRHPFRWEALAFGLLFLAVVGTWAAWKIGVLASDQLAYAPAGTLIVLGHDSTNLADGRGGPKDAAVLFTPEDVTALLGELVLVRAEKVRRTVTLDDDCEAVAIDAYVRATRLNEA